MRTVTIVLVYLMILAHSNAQNKYDYIWLQGAHSISNMPPFGGTKIDFNSGSFDAQYFITACDFTTPGVICDETGQLQFYTNGCNVFDRENNLMQNGDRINEGPTHDHWCSTVTDGYNVEQAMLVLPNPGHPKHYIIFYREDLVLGEPGDVLRYSEVDMGLNNNLGAVTNKNMELMRDTIARSIVATQHGNGRDWWVVVHRYDTSLVYTFLLDPAGIHGPIEHVFKSWGSNFEDIGYSAFSPDGLRYVQVGRNKPPFFLLFDFDRCTGTFCGPTLVPVPDDFLSFAWFQFSPNSRFLYLTNQGSKLYQYDLHSSKKNPSWQVVGEYDGFKDPLPNGFFGMALGPDGKIYMSHNNGSQHLNVIDKPDLLGSLCDFKQHAIKLPTLKTFFLPNFPNFRLYDAPRSICDTLGIDAPTMTGGDSTTMLLKALPNPADQMVNVYLDFPLRPGRLDVFNALGQLIYTEAISGAVSVLCVPTWSWAAGAYFFRVEQKEKASWLSKVMVVH